MTDHEKINQAVRDILARCSQNQRPLDCLAEEVGKLLTDCNWSRHDAKLVSQTALHMLTFLLQPPDGSQEPSATEADSLEEDGA